MMIDVSLRIYRIELIMWTVPKGERIQKGDLGPGKSKVGGREYTNQDSGIHTRNSGLGVFSRMVDYP
jgi:hypothetical protein